MNLYDILGISKETLPLEVIRAYRKLALLTHPDRGGSQEEFESVQLAYDVLGNQERRAHYGEIGDLADNSMAEIMACLNQCFGRVCLTLIQKNMHPHYQDLAEHMRCAVVQMRNSLLEESAGAKDQMNFLQLLAGRFETDGAENTLDDMVEGQIEGLRKIIERFAKQHEHCERALEFLKTYRYRHLGSTT